MSDDQKGLSCVRLIGVIHRRSTEAEYQRFLDVLQEAFPLE